MLGTPHWWCYHIHSTFGPNIPADLKKKHLDKDMHSKAIPKANNCPTNSSLRGLSSSPWLLLQKRWKSSLSNLLLFKYFLFAGCWRLKAEALLGTRYPPAEGSSNHKLLRCFSNPTKTGPQKGAEANIPLATHNTSALPMDLAPNACASLDTLSIHPAWMEKCEFCVKA